MKDLMRSIRIIIFRSSSVPSGHKLLRKSLIWILFVEIVCGRSNSPFEMLTPTWPTPFSVIMFFATQIAYPGISISKCSVKSLYYIWPLVLFPGEINSGAFLGQRSSPWRALNPKRYRGGTRWHPNILTWKIMEWCGQKNSQTYNSIPKVCVP